MTNRKLSEYVSQLCASVSGVVPTDVIFIPEQQEFVKHSCDSTGIVILNKENVTVPTEEGYYSVDVYFCRACGKLYIYREPNY